MMIFISSVTEESFVVSMVVYSIITSRNPGGNSINKKPEEFNKLGRNREIAEKIVV